MSFISNFNLYLALYIFKFVIITVLIEPITSVVVVAPTWITSPYVQADSKRIINGDLCSCTTGSTTTPVPTGTLPFTTAFPSIPNLGYGISNYQGNDNLGSEMFQVNRTGLTTTSFSVLVQISGNTNIWVVQVRYIGISKLFPHHLNSFDNVPVNYNNGALVNITVASASVKTYSNTINYTLQAQSISSTYTKFSIPLTNNKILLFMTSLFVAGTNQPSGATTNLNALNLYVTATPMSQTTYLLYVTYSKNSAITRLHFSMITFDQADVQSSGLYMLIYDKICYPTAGGFYPFQSQFLTNFMVGFVQFSSQRTASLVTFQTKYVTINGSYGAQMPVSTPRSTSRIPLTRFCFTYFYMKTWICPNQTFFDPSINMCTGCPIINCIDCYNLTVCSICNQAAGYFLNSTTGQCQTCSMAGCINCSTPTVCLDCNQAANYILLSNQTCQLCDNSLNYFANSINNTCQLCTIPNCINCTSLTQCSICNSNNSYYLTPTYLCQYCNPLLNYFIDPATNDCDLCAITNCINCSSLTTCLQCNQTANYLLNTTDSLCYLCNIVNCIDCYNFTNCSICDTLNGYVLNINTGLCQLCTLVGCVNCSSLATCVQCNQTSNYVLLGSGTCSLCTNGTFVNVSSNTCQICGLSNCLLCLTLNTCQVCDLNNSYYLATGLTCAYCNNTNNYFINLTNLNCQLCIVANCLVCSNLTNCTQCNEVADYFYNVSNGQCNTCVITGCIDCYNISTCNSCNTTLGYIFNLTTGLCDLCPTGLFPNATSNLCELCSLSFCTLCSSLSTCITCNTNTSYYLDGSTCNYCNSTQNQFINVTTLSCQTCSISHCTNCSSLTTCAICNSSENYILNATDNLCYACTITHCSRCQNFTACLTCQNHDHDLYYLNTTSGLCQRCNLTGCVQCLSLTVCRQCDSHAGFGLDYTSPNMSLCGTCNVSCTCDGYGLPWNTATLSCTPICGDGLIRQTEQCDDGNTNSHDGCSSSCMRQSYFNCTGQPTVCQQTLFIQSQFIQIQKNGCNGFKITTKTPNFTLQQIYNNIAILNTGITITNAIQNNTYIQIYAQYNRDIANQNILLNFSPGQLLNITYQPITPALYYTSSQCNAQSQVQSMLQASQYISYAILLISLLSCKIVGLELFGVLQLSYFTLSSHNFLNVYLSPLAKFRTFNGLNIPLKNQSVELPQNYSKLNVASSFLNNCNIMLLLLLVEFIASLALYIVAKVLKRQKLEKVALRLLKQGFITLVLFNIFNISFSAGVHWKYANPNDEGYLISSILLYGTTIAMVVAVAAMELTAKQDYGEFKNKFKNVWICQIYIPLTVCYRMILGFYSAVKSDYDESTLIIMAFSLAFFMFIIINLPFTNVFQNYRCALIHATMLFTLLTTNYYRSMKSTTPMEIKGRIYTPAIIELILMVSCIGISFVVLAYEVYQLIKSWRIQKKTQNTLTNQRKNTEQSFDNLQ